MPAGTAESVYSRILLNVGFLVPFLEGKAGGDDLGSGAPNLPRMSSIDDMVFLREEVSVLAPDIDNECRDDELWVCRGCIMDEADEPILLLNSASIIRSPSQVCSLSIVIHRFF